ncbi:MAG: beta-N-acetylglucosaminidase domain-containing protein [Alphaproteobacteria bacterium]|nr:beta-N-acetylglucosaminidase domain-containing protein [Alphaproteobacteria bacterium]
MNAPLGIIEGYYGKPWDAEARARVLSRSARHGYSFYIFAPKADRYLRKRWREEHPKEESEALVRLAAHCKASGISFGVGLSPFEIYLSFDEDAKADLKRKLAWIDAMGADTLAILFDDMRGDLPGLAETQAGIMHWIAERTGARRLILCPSYYSDDVGLDRYFGQRPDGYLADLGRTLDGRIEMFWTGEEVCAREIGVAHLRRVAGEMRRKPLLWDNYPVNDGPRMSPYLYLRAFTGRPAAIGAEISGHAVNPALQAELSLIPMLSLAASYREGEDYSYGRAFTEAAKEVLGEEFARMVREDLILFQDVGLGRLGKAEARLRERYGAIDHPAAREIMAWLDGAYRVAAMQD